MIIDSHCHLDFPELYDNLPEILKRADDAGVKKYLRSVQSSKMSRKLEKFHQIIPQYIMLWVHIL